jgi:hypothetical protein
MVRREGPVELRQGVVEVKKVVVYLVFEVGGIQMQFDISCQHADIFIEKKDVVVVMYLLAHTMTIGFLRSQLDIDFCIW